MSALSLRELRKTYKNGFEALQGVDLAVPAGEFFALLGPNGAGKSTMIGIICSLINKTSGEVRIFGHDLSREREAAKRRIGLVPQEINFNQFETVFNIVVNQAGYYGIRRREAMERAERSLRQVSLWDKRHTVSRQLSGGMKRRLMIARALVHDPGLLILDEPTAGVDVEIRHSMWEFLRTINRQGTTVILTTHYLEEAESLCRHIAIIDHGRIVVNSRMQELLTQVQTHRYTLELKQPIDQTPVVDGFVIEPVDAWTLRAELPPGTGIHRLFNELGAQGIEIHGLRNASNRLEQYFMQLVDHRRDSTQEA
ncbi:MAG: ABC transporter ATP-binding protein [Methylotetracoccus sp.]|jgi:ABC-2 type transport system ATP-binding protein|nr:ABC transporter ATP-binding protein [Methylotetracoccus sp.]